MTWKERSPNFPIAWKTMEVGDEREKREPNELFFQLKNDRNKKQEREREEPSLNKNGSMQ